MIGHGGLLRAFSVARLMGMSRGSTPRHAQMAGDLGFAVQFNSNSKTHDYQTANVVPIFKKRKF